MTGRRRQRHSCPFGVAQHQSKRRINISIQGRQHRWKLFYFNVCIHYLLIFSVNLSVLGCDGFCECVNKRDNLMCLANPACMAVRRVIINIVHRNLAHHARSISGCTLDHWLSYLVRSLRWWWWWPLKCRHFNKIDISEKYVCFRQKSSRHHSFMPQTSDAEDINSKVCGVNQKSLCHARRKPSQRAISCPDQRIYVSSSVDACTRFASKWAAFVLSSLLIQSEQRVPMVEKERHTFPLRSRYLCSNVNTTLFSHSSVASPSPWHTAVLSRSQILSLAHIPRRRGCALQHMYFRVRTVQAYRL